MKNSLTRLNPNFEFDKDEDLHKEENKDKNDDEAFPSARKNIEIPNIRENWKIKSHKRMKVKALERKYV